MLTVERVGWSVIGTSCRSPYPLVACGGARLVEQTDLDGDTVGRDVLALLEDAEALAAMRGGLAGTGIEAAAETAGDLVRFLGWEPSSDDA